MALCLTPETEKLVEDHLKRTAYSSADELIRMAMAALRATESDFTEPLDQETLAALKRAEEQILRGETRPWSEVRTELLARRHDPRFRN